MQRNINSLIGYSMDATDGEIGKVEEFYFDDDTWTIRYLVVKTGNWLSGRKVLISPDALIRGSREPGTFPVNLTKEQIRNSPDIDTDKPVYRQHEVELYGHYPWQAYWGSGFYAGGGYWGIGSSYPVIDEMVVKDAEKNDEESHNDLHLRSTHHVTGYHIQATDGEIGHVKDFILGDQSWKLVYLVADTNNWFGGKKVLIAVKDIREVKWENSKVLVDLTIDSVKTSAPFDEPEFIYTETHNTIAREHSIYRE